MTKGGGGSGRRGCVCRVWAGGRVALFIRAGGTLTSAYLAIPMPQARGMQISVSCSVISMSVAPAWGVPGEKHFFYSSHHNSYRFRTNAGVVCRRREFRWCLV